MKGYKDSHFSVQQNLSAVKLYFPHRTHKSCLTSTSRQERTRSLQLTGVLSAVISVQKILMRLTDLFFNYPKGPVIPLSVLSALCTYLLGYLLVHVQFLLERLGSNKFWYIKTASPNSSPAEVISLGNYLFASTSSGGPPVSWDIVRAPDHGDDTFAFV